MKIRYLLIGLCLLLISCYSDITFSLLKGELLFSMDIGKMENQFDFSINNRDPFLKKNCIYVNNSLIYIANGNASKIMQYTPYGNQILLIYNPRINPPPLLLQQNSINGNTDTITNKKTVAFNLIDIGEIAVDSNKNIYLEDRAANEEYVLENGMVFNKIIRRFDQYGNYKDTIGKEGLAGSPFAFIDSFYITRNNELVVITKSFNAWLVYWYLESGNLLYEIEIDNLHIPIPVDSGYTPNLEKIVPDYNKKELYLMISYSQEVYDKSTNTIKTVINRESRVYTLNLKNGKYNDSFIRLAQDPYSPDTLFEQQEEIRGALYEFLGNTESGYFFFLKLKDNITYELLITDKRGTVYKKLNIHIDDTDLVFIAFDLAKNGLLSALICQNNKAKVFWWRSDRLLKNNYDENS